MSCLQTGPTGLPCPVRTLFWTPAKTEVKLSTLMAFEGGTLVFSQSGGLTAAALEEAITAVRDLDLEAALGRAEASWRLSRGCCPTPATSDRATTAADSDQTGPGKPAPRI